ncbi:MBL fold metallo-hydrolase [Lysinibacillus sp. MHQ-1]|nr:MBL fold metallo-hydrolase [Lysinibacillus sp. MHQ-1]
MEQIALTHSHEDHAGNAAWLQQQMDIPIYLHRESLQACTKKGDYPLYRQALWGGAASFSSAANRHYIANKKQLSGTLLKHLGIRQIIWPSIIVNQVLCSREIYTFKRKRR